MTANSNLPITILISIIKFENNCRYVNTEYLGQSDCIIEVDANIAYRIVTVFATIIAILACMNILRGNYSNPSSSKFLYFKFDSLWVKLLGLASLKGMVQGFLVTAPAILIMKFVGEEGTLGLIQGISGGVTAVLVYVLGRVTKPKHRIFVFFLGLIIFFIE